MAARRLRCSAVSTRTGRTGGSSSITPGSDESWSPAFSSRRPRAKNSFASSQPPAAGGPESDVPFGELNTIADEVSLLGAGRDRVRGLGEVTEAEAGGGADGGATAGITIVDVGNAGAAATGAGAGAVGAATETTAGVGGAADTAAAATGSGATGSAARVVSDDCPSPGESHCGSVSPPGFPRPFAPTGGTTMSFEEGASADGAVTAGAIGRAGGTCGGSFGG